eukprot:GILK01008773.1.p3 GENE.GILK01008773.1~~GILK01008773.1.p3  ORF type:complete len:206 (+),score=26.59 GILK01008773.1:3780-4397(+)
MMNIEASEPCETVSMDILGPLPVTERGNQYILVITDYLTRFCEAVALETTEPVQVAEGFVAYWVLQYGAPKRLLSDRGANFLSEVVRWTCQVLRVKKINTASYHPQCNGLTERFNKTLCDMISMYVQDGHKNWDEFLPYAVCGYRSSYQPSLGDNPYFLMYGRDFVFPTDVALGLEINPAESIKPGIYEYKQQFLESREDASQDQ